MKLFNKINLIFFLFVGILLFLFTIFKSEIIHGGLIRSHYYIYYIFAFTIILLSLLIQLFDEKIRTNINLMLVTSFLLLLIIETLLEFKLHHIFFDNKNFSPMNQKDFIVKKRKNGDDSFVLRILPGALLPHGLDNSIFPASGISKKNTVMCEEGAGMITYLSDRYGFNNDDKMWDKNIKAILIGDSFVNGDCVKRNNTISQNLNKFDNVNNFINLGMGGNGPLINLMTLREYGFLKNPKLILWFYFEGNDLIELTHENSSKILNNYINDEKFSQNLSNKVKLIDKSLTNIFNKIMSNYNLIQNFNNSIKRIIIFKNIRGLANNFLKSYFIINKPDINKFIAIIKRAKLLAEKNEAIFYFVYLPSYERYSKKVNDDNFLYKNNIINSLNSNNINIIDISENVFNKSNDPLSYFPNRKNGHYNDRGYYDVSAFIYKSLFLNE